MEQQCSNTQNINLFDPSNWPEYFLPPSVGQLMCLWFLPFSAEQGGVVKNMLSAFKWPLDLAGCIVTLYLHENNKPGRIMW